MKIETIARTWVPLFSMGFAAGHLQGQGRIKIPMLEPVDGGFRRGTDVFKALALGASAVGVGRPYLSGLAAFGKRGVARVMELLRAELAVDMAMAGVSKISEIGRSFVRIRQ